MREIKFRGMTVEGEIYEGDLIHDKFFGTGLAIRTASGALYEVEKVAQYITPDKNGVEVYEGDTLLVDQPEGTERRFYTAGYQGFGTAPDGRWIAESQIGKISAKTDEPVKDDEKD